MSETQQDNIVAVGAIVHKDGTAPNRKQRRTDFNEVVSFPLEGHKNKLRVFNQKSTGVLLFVMPDDTVYEVNPKMVINQVLSHWQLPPADTGAAEPENTEGRV